MTSEAAQGLLALLNTLPPEPTITFRGYIDRSVTEPRPIHSPGLTPTSHSISIATNNLEKPEVAIFIGATGRDLTPILEGAPSFNLQEVTYLPGSFFYQRPTQDFLGVTIQIFEELRLAEDGQNLEQTRILESWDPILMKFEPALHQARTAHLDLPEGASERFLSPLD